MGRRLEELEQPKANKRARARTDLTGKIPASETGRVRDKVGAHIGVSGKTYEKAVLERGEHLTRRKEIYETIHPVSM